MVPLFASDQLVNAVHVAAAGAGVLLPQWDRAHDELAEAVRTVLSDHSYSRAAHEVATAIGDLPLIASAVPILKALAADSD